MANDTNRTVVIADDDVMVRRVLEQTLQAAGLRVLHAAETGGEAYDSVCEHGPDLLLLDLLLPDEDGISVTRRLRRAGHDLRIVMLSIRADEDTAVEALLAGANGYLSKALPLERLPRALEAVLDGEDAISRRLAGQLIERLRDAHRGGVRPVRSLLSSREWEVLDLLCRQLSTEQIASALAVSPETVRTHIKHILQKTGLSSREDVVRHIAELRRRDGVDPFSEPSDLGGVAQSL